MAENTYHTQAFDSPSKARCRVDDFGGKAFDDDVTQQTNSQHIDQPCVSNTKPTELDPAEAKKKKRIEREPLFYCKVIVKYPFISFGESLFIKIINSAVKLSSRILLHVWCIFRMF